MGLEALGNLGDRGVSELNSLLNSWVLIGQGLIGSLGTLAFVCAFVWRIVAPNPHSAMEAQRWLARIAVGTLGVELAGLLTHVLLAAVPRSLGGNYPLTVGS